MNTHKLHSEMLDLSMMFMTSETLLRRFYDTKIPEQQEAVKVLIEAEKNRIREAMTTLQNNLSAEFYVAMKKLHCEQRDDFQIFREMDTCEKISEVSKKFSWVSNFQTVFQN